VVCTESVPVRRDKLLLRHGGQGGRRRARVDHGRVPDQRIMINMDGVRWGTAAEIATHLGHGVAADEVRSWAAGDGLASARLTDERGFAGWPARVG
jgi:hypothetical protein